MRKWLVALATTLGILATTLGQSSTSNANTPFVMTKHPMIYFVMLDRFSNGDTSNDQGGLSGDWQKTGFYPTDPGFYHGGDLAGLVDKIPYIKSLGFTAIWVTPVVRQKAVSPDGGSAAYHGYWGAGFDQVDPHLGTMQEFKDFVSTAHAAGLGVIVDIVVNHTADVIYSSAGTMYSPSDFYPWRTVKGKVFNAAKLAGTSQFPQLSQLSEFTSFPNPPLVNIFDDNVKSPAWLNDVRNYHNRGNTTFEGESSQYGDFFGLDDLFTESPVVVKGMTKVFSDWISSTGIDGFRIDTARHVNPRFWKAFLPAMRHVAATQGKAYFPMWGEVYDSDPTNTSYWVKNARFTEVLDFPLQDRLINFVLRGSSSGLATLFSQDDLYTSRTSNASQLATFLGNHDMGRIGSFIANQGGSTADQLAKDEMAHALLFTLRGNPSVYYGDEFGLKGGNDKLARQDLFPTQVGQWKNESRIGGQAIGTGSSFDTVNPLQGAISSLTSLRSSTNAFSEGPQIIRYAQSGIFAFSRFDTKTNREYVCAFNAGTSDTNISFPVGTTNTTWSAVRGSATLHNNGTNVSLSLPSGSWSVFKAADTVKSTPTVGVQLQRVLVSPDDSGHYQISARTVRSPFARVEFFAKRPGGQWTSLGYDQSPTFVPGNVSGASGLYRVFPQRVLFVKGVKYQFKAVVQGVGGIRKSSLTQALVVR